MIAVTTECYSANFQFLRCANVYSSLQHDVHVTLQSITNLIAPVCPTLPPRAGNVAAITTYIRAGGNLYAQDRQGNPPLHVVRSLGRHYYCCSVGCGYFH